jgi:hypothetical protein
VNLEELLREERHRPAPNPLAGRVDQIVAKVRRRRRVRAAAAGVAGLATAAALIVGATQLLAPRAAMSPADSAPVSDPSSSPFGQRLSVDDGWGREGPYLGVDGVLHVGADMQPEVEQIGAFTVIPSGVVYIDATTSRVVWRDWNRQTTVLGEAPWRAEESTLPGGPRPSNRGGVTVMSSGRQQATWWRG